MLCARFASLSSASLMSIALTLLVGAVLASAGPSVSAQTLPTALVGDDLAALREACKKDPTNIGLKMRLVRKRLKLVADTDNVRYGRDLLDKVEKDMEAIRKLGPRFPYPYRVLARIYYQRDEGEKLLGLLDEYGELGATDQEMRSLRVKALLRMATRVENPQPQRKKEAAEYVGNWFDSGEAPSFGTTLGACAVWLIDDDFKKDLLGVFAGRYEKDPANLNLVISYAACLQALGRNESAWTLVRKAEQHGLSDTVTGSRHPVAHLLEMQCPEIDKAQSYWNMEIDDLDALMKKHPKNASFPLRAAIILKRRGDAATQITLLCDRRIEEENEASGGKAPAEFVRTFTERRMEFDKKARENYAASLPYALKARELNSKLEATALVLGDVSYKLGKLDDAVKYFREGLELVPYYLDLREGLSRVYADKKDWTNAAEELVKVCRVSAVDAANWDEEALDSLVPVPRLPREKLVVEMAENPQARKALVAALEKAAAAQPKNPNLRGYLAMTHYFGRNKAEATRWMLDAERQGLCGDDGLEHTLASYIYSREAW